MNRVPAWPLIATTLITAACSARRPAPVASAPTVAAPGADELPVAAGASGYFSFRLGDGAAAPAIPQLKGIRAQLPQLLGLDPFAPAVRAQLAADPARPSVISWAVVDADRLAALLAAPEPPPPQAPFTVRTEVVMAVVDPARTAEALAAAVLEPGCARPSDDAAWATWLATLPDAEARQAAASAGAAYACWSAIGSTVARLDAGRRLLTWTTAMGLQGSMAAAVAPLPRSPDTVAQLQRAGFFTADHAYYSRPIDVARGGAAMAFMKSLTGLAGLGPDLQGLVWGKSTKELAEFTRFAESEPRLFAAMAARNGRTSWELTEEGRALFSREDIKAAAGSDRLGPALAQQIEPQGCFASATDLGWAKTILRETAPALVAMFLWPHALAYASRRGGESPFAPMDLRAFERLAWRLEGSQLVVERKDPAHTPASAPRSP